MLQNFLPFKTFIILFNMSTNLFLGKSDKNLLLGIWYLAQRSIRALAHFGVTLVTVMLISRKNPIFSSHWILKVKKSFCFLRFVCFLFVLFWNLFTRKNWDIFVTCARACKHQVALRQSHCWDLYCSACMPYNQQQRPSSFVSVIAAVYLLYY